MRNATKTGLTGTAQVLYFIVMAAGALLDLGILIALLATRNIGPAIVFLVFGGWIIPSIAHVVGLALAAPFAAAVVVAENREATGNPVGSSSNKMPAAVGWACGLMLAQVEDGTFRPHKEGVVFTPTGSQSGNSYIYRWAWFEGAQIERASDHEHLVKAHATILALGGVEKPKSMVVAFLDTRVSIDRTLTIIPCGSRTVDEWLRRFDKAGVPIGEAADN